MLLVILSNRNNINLLMMINDDDSRSCGIDGVLDNWLDSIRDW